MRACLLRSDGAAVARGQNVYGKCSLPAPHGDLTFTQVAAGTAHTVLLRSETCAAAFGRAAA